MKSTKIFAILTIVAFLMTLVPMAAFGIALNPADCVTSQVAADKDSLVADNDTMVKFSVYLFDSGNAKAADQEVYVASDRPTVDKFYDADGEVLLTGAGNIYTTEKSENSKLEFKLKSSKAGTSHIAVGLVKYDGATQKLDLYKYVSGEYNNTIQQPTATTVGLIAQKTITFTAGGVGDNGVLVDSIKDRTGAVAATGMTADGGDYYRIYFQVVSASGAGIPDEKVTFSVNKSGATLGKSEDTTDAQGMVDVKVYATKDGDYKVKAAAGGEDVEATVTFGAGEAAAIALDDTDNQKIALDQEDGGCDFIVSDAAGNNMTGAQVETAWNLDHNFITIDVVDEPTDSDLAGGSNLSIVDDGGDDAWLNISKITEEGAYKIRLELENGKSITFSFTVKDQGTITGLTLSYKQAALPLGGVSSTPTIKRVDADGYKLTPPSSDVKYFTSDPLMATIASNGTVTATKDKDFVGDFVITAVDTVKNVTATANMAVAKAAYKLVFDVPASTVPGTTATVTVKTVDKDGKAVSLGTEAGVTSDAWIISSPADSSKAVSAENDFSANMQKYGAADFSVDCDKAGTIKLQVSVKQDNAGTDHDVNLTGSTDVVFAAAAPAKVVIGAKAVTMFIGATGYVQDGVAKVADVAPFVSNGRTFVAVKPVAEAFGATAAYDAATQTVTLTRSDMTVTIVIGSPTITVIKDGVTTTVTADVAAAINAGRTVLPFRAVGDAFGATVSYDATTQAVSFAQ